MHWLNDRDCHSGSKNKTQFYVVYKKPTLNIKVIIIYIYLNIIYGWKVNGEKYKIYYTNTNQ